MATTALRWSRTGKISTHYIDHLTYQGLITMQSTNTLLKPLRSGLETATDNRATTKAMPWEAPATSSDDLTIIFESFLGQLLPSQGFLLLDAAGQLIQMTSKAQVLCEAINKWSGTENRPSQPDAFSSLLPTPVVKLYELLLDSRTEFPGLPVQMTEAVSLQNGHRVALNGEWIDLGGQLSQCILVKLEDIAQTMAQRARCDAYRYDFTARETEVWTLRLQGLSYQEIGQQLFITTSTVKKHTKNINAKRRTP